MHQLFNCEETVKHYLHIKAGPPAKAILLMDNVLAHSSTEELSSGDGLPHGSRGIV